MATCDLVFFILAGNWANLKVSDEFNFGPDQSLHSGVTCPCESDSTCSFGSFCHIYRVTDEALIAETAVWPNFFLMNVFFALKGS